MIKRKPTGAELMANIPVSKQETLTSHDVSLLLLKHIWFSKYSSLGPSPEIVIQFVENMILFAKLQLSWEEQRKTLN